MKGQEGEMEDRGDRGREEREDEGRERKQSFILYFIPQMLSTARDSCLSMLKPEAQHSI